MVAFVISIPSQTSVVAYGYSIGHKESKRLKTQGTRVTASARMNKAPLATRVRALSERIAEASVQC